MGQDDCAVIKKEMSMKLFKRIVVSIAVIIALYIIVIGGGILV